MKCLFVVAAIIVFSCAAADAQVFKSKDGYRLDVEFVQEPVCPIKISVKSTDLDKPPSAQSIMLQIDNTSEKAIRAFALISGGNEHPNLHTLTFATAPFGAGKTMYRSIWPNSQEHYYFFFDYILYTDGTTCGWNNHHRSTQIESYLESRQKALAKLKEIAAQYKDPDEIIAELEKDGAYASMDNPGPPNPDTIKAMPRRAWEHVIAQLRRMPIRQKDATELALRLELLMPETPKDP